LITEYQHEKGLRLKNDYFNLQEIFTKAYRYPFKLVIRRRFYSASTSKHLDKRHSPPGFNPYLNEEKENSDQEKKIEKIIKYDLYLEPDSIKKLSNIILYVLSMVIVSISFYLNFSKELDSVEQCYNYPNNIIEFVKIKLYKVVDLIKHQDLTGFSYFFIKTIFPSLVFFTSYYSMMRFIVRFHYRRYPLFIKSWSKKMNCYDEWFAKIPQEIHLERKDRNCKKYYISQFTEEKTIVHKRERQALYYAWHSGSSQKSMWLLAIEEIIHEWETKGIFKQNTSFIVLFSPIWIAYLSLIILLLVSDLFNLSLLKNLYIPIMIWIVLSFTYLLVIYMFITERKECERTTSRQISRFIPHELRSITPRHNKIYERFKAESFITLVNFLFVALLIFYVTVLSLIK